MFVEGGESENDPLFTSDADGAVALFFPSSLLPQDNSLTEWPDVLLNQVHDRKKLGTKKPRNEENRSERDDERVKGVGYQAYESSKGIATCCVGEGG